MTDCLPTLFGAFWDCWHIMSLVGLRYDSLVEGKWYIVGSHYYGENLILELEFEISST